MPVSQFMAAANAQYYATQQAIGAGGDFVTAPEISQMFGELIGLWCADLWDRAGRPEALGSSWGRAGARSPPTPGRAMAKAGFEPPVHFVETSPRLRDLQAAAVAGCDLP